MGTVQNFLLLLLFPQKSFLLERALKSEGISDQAGTCMCRHILGSCQLLKRFKVK